MPKCSSLFPHALTSTLSLKGVHAWIRSSHAAVHQPSPVTLPSSPRPPCLSRSSANDDPTSSQSNDIAPIRRSKSTKQSQRNGNVQIRAFQGRCTRLRRQDWDMQSQRIDAGLKTRLFSGRERVLQNQAQIWSYHSSSSRFWIPRSVHRRWLPHLSKRRQRSKD